LLQVVNSTIHDACRKEQVGYEAIMGMIDRHIQSHTSGKAGGLKKGEPLKAVT
jgi:hypothetical protein